MRSERLDGGGLPRTFDPEAASEVDLGPHIRGLRRRWWALVAGFVAGAALGLGLAVGHGQTFAATATIYLGLPYASGDVALQSAQTNPATLGVIVHSAEIDARAGRVCRAPASTFSGGISTQQMVGTFGRNKQNAFVTLTVFAGRRAIARCAANALARLAVGAVGSYARGKIAAYRAALTAEALEIKQTEAALARPPTSTSGRLVQRSRLLSLQVGRANLRTLLGQTIQLELPRQIGRARPTRVTARTGTTSALVGGLIGAILATLATVLWGVRRPPASSSSAGAELSRPPVADRLLKWLTTGTLIALLVGTAAAFAITERLKLVPSPIIETVVSKTFSPVCRCATASAQISFRLRRGGRVGVEVIHARGDAVRRLAMRHFKAGVLSFRWFGLGTDGRMSADGYYQVRVDLFSERRTIVLPNRIRLDTVPPKVQSVRLERAIAYVGERVRTEYEFGEVAHPVLLVDGVRMVRGRFPFRRGSLDWFGRIKGRPVRPGIHVLSVEARDSAGNVSPASEPLAVRIRRRVRTHSHKSAKH